MKLKKAIKKYKKKALKYEQAWNWDESHVGLDADDRNLRKMIEYNQLVDWLEELYKLKSDRAESEVEKWLK